MGFEEQSGGWVWGEQSRGWRLGSRMGCMEGRMGTLFKGMGCKEFILGCI